MNLRQPATVEEPSFMNNQKNDKSVFELLILLAQNKKFILQFTLALTLVGAIIIFLVPNRYTAEAVVLPPAQGSSMAAALMNQIGGGGSLASLASGTLGIKNPGDMYVSLFRSRTVEDAVIQRFHLMSHYRKKRMADTRKKLESHVSVELGSKDGLIRVAATDWDPKLAADLANGYVDEFRKLSATLAITEAAQRRVFFEQQLTDARHNLATAEDALKQTEQTTGVVQIDSQARALIESAAALRAQITAKQVQIQGMRSFATEDNPELVTARQQLSALQAQLAKLGGNEQDPDSLVVPKGKVPEAGIEYIRHYREVKYYETIYELIAKQFELAKLDEARQGAIIQVADVAIPPDKKSFPMRSMIIAVIFCVALILCCVIVLLREAFFNAETADRMRTLRSVLGTWN